jgi:hypothetical protein
MDREGETDEISVMHDIPSTFECPLFSRSGCTVDDRSLTGTESARREAGAQLEEGAMGSGLHLSFWPALDRNSRMFCGSILMTTRVGRTSPLCRAMCLSIWKC